MSFDQVNAGLRHAGTAAATVVSVFAAFGFIPQDQVAEVIADLHQVADGLTNAVGGMSKLTMILGPLAMAWIARAAVTSASLKRQLTAVVTNKQVEIDGTIIAPAAIANAVPSDKVVPPK